MSAPTVSLSRPSHLSEHRLLRSQNLYAAETVLEMLDRFLSIKSVLDLGCGIGTWMQVAQAKPGREALGVEVERFQPDELLVPEQSILHFSLERPVDLHRQFDLVLCLETAEHLPPEGAPQLVSNCVRHSNIVLFSAAIPGQGGLNHLNEQPPEYWCGLFDQSGYEVVDLLRPMLWRDSKIPVWYRQNMLLFVNRSDRSTLSLLRSEAEKTATPLHRAHPDLFEWQARELALCNVAPQARQPDGPSPNLGVAELQAELAAQREYSGRVLGEVWELVNRLRCQSASRPMDERLARATQEISDLRSSLSWRITAPLRAVGGLLLRLRNR